MGVKMTMSGKKTAGRTVLFVDHDDDRTCQCSRAGDSCLGHLFKDVLLKTKIFASWRGDQGFLRCPLSLLLIISKSSLKCIIVGDNMLKW